MIVSSAALASAPSVSLMALNELLMCSREIAVNTHGGRFQQHTHSLTYIVPSSASLCLSRVSLFVSMCLFWASFIFVPQG